MRHHAAAMCCARHWRKKSAAEQLKLTKICGHLMPGKSGMEMSEQTIKLREAEREAVMRRSYQQMPVKVPVKDVLIRLGTGNAGGRQRLEMEQQAQKALMPLRPDGLCLLLPLTVMQDAICLENLFIGSRNLAAQMAGCRHGLVMVSTLGTKIMEDIQSALAQGRADWAVVLDAAASEAADAGLDFMMAQSGQDLKRLGLAVQKRRFSPGYGDCELSVQRQLFDLLGAEELGLRLTESHLMVPEKSVIAICGVKGCE